MKHSFLLSLLMLVWLGVFAKSPNVPNQNAKLDSLQSNIESQKSIIESQQTSISTLQDSIQNLKRQISKLEDEVQNVSKDNSRMNTNMAFWLAILTITMALLGIGFGIIAPLGINRESAKNAHKAKLLAKNAQNQVAEAQSAAKDARNKVYQANQALAEAKQNAESGFKKAKAIQYFIQAQSLQLTDPNKAIELYTQCIEEDGTFAEAYNYRGFLRHKIGALNAMDDYITAITLFEKQGRGIYAEAYNNRGILLFDNEKYDEALVNFNAAISEDFTEAYLNRGLLYFRDGKIIEAKEDFDNAIDKNSDFAEAYYIRGLWLYSDNKIQDAVKDIIKAKDYKPNVVEALSIRNFLADSMKILDLSINRVEYSKNMNKLIRVPKDNVGSFIIPFFVMEIGREAFGQCFNLTKIMIPNSVTIIGDGAFWECTSLKSVVIPDSVTEIGYSAFNTCTSLNSIKIPSGVKIIADNTFRDCASLTSIEISNGVKIIGDSAFSGCTSLTSIVIPDSVTKIRNNAFACCTNLKEIFVNDNNEDYCSKDGVLYSKDMSALISVPGVKDSIEIPDSVTEIGDCAFKGCGYLKDIIVDNKNHKYCSENGILFSKNKSVMITVPEGKDSIIIPDSVTSIGAYALRGCSHLISIVIPKSVNTIGFRAFDGCTSIKEMHFKHNTPINFYILAFWGLDISKVTIYVPKDSVELYKHNSLYSKFAKVEIEKNDN